MENVSAIKGNIELRSNDALIDLTALSNVTSIEGELWIEGNEALESLEGLHNIDPQTIEISEFYNDPDLRIKNNNNLSICNLKNICEFISNDLGKYAIENNFESCMDEEAVLERCMSVSTTFLSKIDNKVYSNPFTENVTIIVSGDDFMTITDLQGRKCVGQKLNEGENTIDLHELGSGIYFVQTLHLGTFKIVKL